MRRDREPNSSTFYRTWRDGHVFYTISQHFVLGYFHWVPPGRTPLGGNSTVLCRSALAAAGRSRAAILPDMNSNNNALPN
jgi:hypothetical protein